MTKEWFIDTSGMTFNNKTTVSLALEKFPGDNVTFEHPEKIAHVIEYSAYEKAIEFISEIAKGPYKDSDLKSLLETYTKRATTILMEIQ